MIALAGAVVLAVFFAALAEPFLHLILNRNMHGLAVPIALCSVMIVARFGALVLNVDILRAGRQREQIPIVAVAAGVLVAGAIVAALAHSITGVASARLLSEVLIAVGFVTVSRLAPRRFPTVEPWTTLHDPS